MYMYTHVVDTYACRRKKVSKQVEKEGRRKGGEHIYTNSMYVYF